MVVQVLLLGLGVVKFDVVVVLVVLVVTCLVLATLEAGFEPTTGTSSFVGLVVFATGVTGGVGVFRGGTRVGFVIVTGLVIGGAGGITFEKYGIEFPVLCGLTGSVFAFSGMIFGFSIVSFDSSWTLFGSVFTSFFGSSFFSTLSLSSEIFREVSSGRGVRRRGSLTAFRRASRSSFGISLSIITFFFPS